MNDPGTDQAVLEALARLEAGARWEDVAASLRAENPAALEQLEQVERVRAALRPTIRPREFPGFRIEAEIGRGTSGTVLRAYDETLQREVALKVLHGARGSAALAEARRLARLDHPGVVRVHSVLERPNATALVMEWVNGRSLEELQGEEPRAVVGLLEHLARALAACHTAGVVHRDLKPANVRVDARGLPKLLDFGLGSIPANAGDGDASAPPRPGFAGTPLFTSPEQACGGSAEPASDVFSFGSVAYWLLCGRAPFLAAGVEEVLERVRAAEPEPLRRFEPRVPVGLQSIVLACLAKDPARRPSAEQVARELHRFRKGDSARLRPAMFRDRVRHNVLSQWQEVDDWQEQGILAAPEADPLRVLWRRLLTDENDWVLDARRVAWPQVLVFLGVWALVVANGLFVWHARADVAGAARWAAPLLGWVALLIPGTWFQLRREREFAAVFLAGAVVAAASVALAVFAEHAWFAAADPEITALLPGLYSNAQLLAASGLATGLSLLGWAVLRFTALAWSSVLLVATTWWSWRLVHGWLDREPEWQAAELLPLAALSLPAVLFESNGRPRWSQPFHAVAVIALVAALDVMAFRGPTLAMLGIDHEMLDEDRRIALSLALNGGLFLGLMLALERCRSLDLRRGAQLLQWLVPAHFLGALYGNAWREAATRLDAWGFCIAVGVVVALGAFRERRRLLFSGRTGLRTGEPSARPPRVGGRASVPRRTGRQRSASGPLHALAVGPLTAQHQSAESGVGDGFPSAARRAIRRQPVVGSSTAVIVRGSSPRERRVSSMLLCRVFEESNAEPASASAYSRGARPNACAADQASSANSPPCSVRTPTARSSPRSAAMSTQRASSATSCTDGRPRLQRTRSRYSRKPFASNTRARRSDCGARPSSARASSRKALRAIA